eukprot:scaffold131454_cov18-Tisochrysis_lutea.AAC.2
MTWSVVSCVPFSDLSGLPLPAAAKKNPGAQGLRQIRELVVLARNVARYTDNLGVSEISMDVAGYTDDLVVLARNIAWYTDDLG